MNDRITKHTNELKEFEEESVKLSEKCESLNVGIKDDALKLSKS